MLRLVTVVCAVLIVFSSTATGLVLYQGFTSGHRFRQSQAQVWHDVICAIEAEIPTSKASAATKQKAKLFYDRLLVLAHARPCL
jgi:hypothetical protein